MNKLVLIFTFTIFCTTTAIAYVPKFWTISNRVSAKRKGLPVKVVQLVTASDLNGENSYSFKETLYIKSGQQLKIVTQGIDGLENRLNISRIYSNNEKIDFSVGQVQKSPARPGFYTPLLYLNEGASLRKMLNLQNYVPANALVTPKFSYATKSYDTMPENFTSLSRTNGYISFAISTQLSSAEKISPTVFVSQENFHIAKIVPAKGQEIVFSDYKEYMKKFWHPKETTIHHGSRFKYQIKTLSITKTSSSEVEKAVRSIVQTESTIPNINAISEFFRTYR